MNGRPMVSEGSKPQPSQNGAGNVGQYVPQVFMVPYYAPQGFSGFPHGQQPHPQIPQQMFGHVPPGMHPAPMQMPGMSQMAGMSPMPGMPQTPMTPATTHSGQASVNSESQSAAASSQSKAKPKMKEANEEASEKATKSYQSIQQQFQIPRACWSFIEEEILVKAYAEHTLGKKLRKMNKKIWESIAEQLYMESQEQLPHVAMKSWMQCKDKWNNMIKKHKYHKSDHVERSAVFEAIERILSYENGANMAACPDQDGIQSVSENEEASMIDARKEYTALEQGEDESPTTKGGQRNNEEDIERGMNTQTDAGSCGNVACEPSEVIDDSDHDEPNSHNAAEFNSAITMSNNNKRQFQDCYDGNADDENACKISKTTENIDDKLCRILTRQTELLEKVHTQHCELLEHVRMSEENTRMMVSQAIKDLGTILNRLIKTEHF